MIQQDLKLEAIRLIEMDKPGVAIDVLQALCALNILEATEAFDKRHKVVPENEVA